jgi:hypothetical protein
MSALYAQAITQGIGTLQLLAGGDNAGTIGAFNAEYNKFAKQYAALDAKNTAESNISAINQDKILSNVAIQMKQQEAQAAAQVSAAVAGVEGGSVDAGMYSIDANAAMAVSQMEAKADQLTEQQLAMVASAQTTFNSVPETHTTSAFAGAITEVAGAVGNLTADDFANMEAKLYSEDAPTKAQYDPRTNNGNLWSK